MLRFVSVWFSWLRLFLLVLIVGFFLIWCGCVGLVMRWWWGRVVKISVLIVWCFWMMVVGGCWIISWV